MVVVNDEFDRMVAIINELSIQLSANRSQCVALKRQAEELKIQAVHTGTGFTLRRFNVDISKGEGFVSRRAMQRAYSGRQKTLRVNWNV